MTVLAPVFKSLVILGLIAVVGVRAYRARLVICVLAELTALSVQQDFIRIANPLQDA